MRVLAGEGVAADAVADAVQKQHQLCPQTSVLYAGKWAASLQHAPKGEGTLPHKKNRQTGKVSSTILSCHLKCFLNFWELLSASTAETIDVNGLPFTPDESVSDPTLTDSLIPVGRLKEDGFDVSFRIPVESHIDGVDLTVYPKYRGRIITPGPDSRTVFMEYEEETGWLPRPHVSSKRVIPTAFTDHATLIIFPTLAEYQVPDKPMGIVRQSERGEERTNKRHDVSS